MEIPSQILTEPAEYLRFWRVAVALMVGTGLLVGGLCVWVAMEVRATRRVVERHAEGMR